LIATANRRPGEELGCRLSRLADQRHRSEILTFDGDKISRVEVYFGWDL
jgi:hypothetical protein